MKTGGATDRDRLRGRFGKGRDQGVDEPLVRGPVIARARRDRPRGWRHWRRHRRRRPRHTPRPDPAPGPAQSPARPGRRRAARPVRPPPAASTITGSSRPRRTAPVPPTRARATGWPGIDGQGTLIGRARRVASSHVLVQIAQVQQGRQIVGRDRQRRLQLDLGQIAAAQIIGLDDAAVQTHLFRSRHAAFQRLVIGGQRRLEPPGTDAPSGPG